MSTSVEPPQDSQPVAAQVAPQTRLAAGLTVHLVKRDRRRTHELQAWFDHVHRRHDALDQAVDRAIAAAERAEAAATRPQ